jgi:Xaa-Pro aminopeptidase
MNPVANRNKQLFETANVNAVLLRTSEELPDANVSYFTGLNKLLLAKHALVLKPSAQPLLLKSILEPKISVKGVRIKGINRRKEFKSSLKHELKGARRIGINKPLYSSAAIRSLRKITGKRKLVDVSKQLASMRAIKSKEEIANIRTACRISEDVGRKIPRLFKKGMTEKQLALKIEVLLREKGENRLSFPVIIASGKNAAFPHHLPGNKKIGKGLLLIDFGAYHKNYCSDITRMFCVGKPTEKQKQLYASVFAAKHFGQALCEPGASFGEIFEEAAKFLKKETGYKLIHGLGHGLGIKAHDFPSGFLEGNKEKLKENMVLTVEPGIYGKFGGIRVEDDVVITANGCKPLSKAPAELIRL